MAFFCFLDRSQDNWKSSRRINRWLLGRALAAIAADLMANGGYWVGRGMAASRPTRWKAAIQRINFGRKDCTMFTVEDETHSEPGAEFTTKEEALVELHRLATLPWDKPPNRAPCTSWQTCGRRYALVEYDQRYTPWRRLSSVTMLDVSSKGARWLP